MKTETAKSYTEGLQDIVEAYRAANEPWPTDLRTIAGWAIQNKLWSPGRRSAVSLLAGDLGQALREEMMEDPQGRRVRRKHARKVKEKLPTGEWIQRTFWDDISTATPEHMLVSFQQRRRMILGDCHQLDTDKSNYNENYNPGESIQISLDFTEDVAELNLPAHYDNEDFGAAEEDEET
jgi:hypothetical protein